MHEPYEECEWEEWIDGLGAEIKSEAMRRITENTPWLPTAAWLSVADIVLNAIMKSWDAGWGAGWDAALVREGPPGISPAGEKA